MSKVHRLHTEQEMKALGASLRFDPGDAVFIYGELGAGKTTLVRGYLEALGLKEPVRSPTFGLMQVFNTKPPVLHADLYRVATYQGIGIEDYLSSHVCFIEWADRAAGLLGDEHAWHIRIEFAPNGRIVGVDEPLAREQSK